MSHKEKVTNIDSCSLSQIGICEEKIIENFKIFSGTLRNS